MEYDEFKEDDNDIHKIGVENKDFHTINKRTYKFEIDYDPNEGDGEYSSRLSIYLVFMVIILWFLKCILMMVLMLNN